MTRLRSAVGLTLVYLLASLVPVGLRAQYEQGTFTGTVQDAKGLPMSGWRGFLWR